MAEREGIWELMARNIPTTDPTGRDGEDAIRLPGGRRYLKAACGMSMKKGAFNLAELQS
jgi:hypothetical protein